MTVKPEFKYTYAHKRSLVRLRRLYRDVFGSGGMGVGVSRSGAVGGVGTQSNIPVTLPQKR